MIAQQAMNPFEVPAANDEHVVISTGTVTILLIADGASIGRVAVLDSVTATTQIIAPVVGKLRFTPSAASHTYGISAFASNTGGTPAVGAGAAGAVDDSPPKCAVTGVGVLRLPC